MSDRGRAEEPDPGGTVLQDNIVYDNWSVNLYLDNQPNGTIVNITSAANAIQIANTASGTIRGLTIGNTTGSGIANAGASFGTLTVSDLTKNGTGAALNLTSGTLNGTIDSLTSTSSTNVVSLTTVGGTLTITTGAISGATGADFLISGGNGTLSYGGTITNTAGRSIDAPTSTH